MGACGGTRCLARTAEVFVEELHASPADHLVELHGAMDARFIGKRPVLEGATLATEELNQSLHFLTGNLGPAFRAAALSNAETTAVVVADRGAPADAPATRAESRILAGERPAGLVDVAAIPSDRT
jgi:hypothetical protein